MVLKSHGHGMGFVPAALNCWSARGIWNADVTRANGLSPTILPAHFVSSDVSMALVSKIIASLGIPNLTASASI